MPEGGPEPYLLRRQLEPDAKRATSKSGEQIERLLQLDSPQARGRARRARFRVETAGLAKSLR